MVELIRVGRTPEDLEKAFEPTAQTIRNWLAEADARAGRRADVLTSDERTELLRLRRENKHLTVEREIRARDAAWFARETGSVPEKSSNS